MERKTVNYQILLICFCFALLSWYKSVSLHLSVCVRFSEGRMKNYSRYNQTTASTMYYLGLNCQLAINRHKIVNKTWNKVTRWMDSSIVCNLLCTVILMRLRFASNSFRIARLSKIDQLCSNWSKNISVSLLRIVYYPKVFRCNGSERWDHLQATLIHIHLVYKEKTLKWAFCMWIMSHQKG